MAVKAFLYSADEPDHEPDLSAISVQSLSSRQLLWVDLISPTREEVEQVAAQLGFEARLLRPERSERERPTLSSYGSHFRITARAVSLAGANSQVDDEPLTLVAGNNHVVTLHDEGLNFLDDLRNREKGDSTIGTLSSESFVASLLDWLLDTYFHSLEALVRDIDRVEVAILGKKIPPEFLRVLVSARKLVAVLRRLLVAHRDVFYGLARPDFVATERPDAKPHFEALSHHYERAEDDLENARMLVIGSFDLLSTRAAQKTNETMRALTYVTVLMGSLAFMAGLLGMNFELRIYQSGTMGFLLAVGGMLAFAIISLVIAIRRKWI